MDDIYRPTYACLQTNLFPLSPPEARNRLFAFIYTGLYNSPPRNYGGELYTRYCSPTNPLSPPRMGELFTGNLINSLPYLRLEERAFLLPPCRADFVRDESLFSFNRSRSGWESFLSTRGWGKKEIAIEIEKRKEKRKMAGQKTRSKRSWILLNVTRPPPPLGTSQQLGYMPRGNPRRRKGRRCQNEI